MPPGGLLVLRSHFVIFPFSKYCASAAGPPGFYRNTTDPWSGGLSVLCFADGEVVRMPLDLIHEVAAEAVEVLADLRLGADVVREAEEEIVAELAVLAVDAGEVAVALEDIEVAEAVIVGDEASISPPARWRRRTSPQAAYSITCRTRRRSKDFCSTGYPVSDEYIIGPADGRRPIP